MAMQNSCYDHTDIGKTYVGYYQNKNLPNCYGRVVIGKQEIKQSEGIF
jgi:hypothetical protein